MRGRLGPMSTTALIVLGCTMLDAVPEFGIGAKGAVWAQDNGGDSDDGGGTGGFENGGDSGDDAIAPNRQPCAVTPVVVAQPVSAPREIVVSDLSDPVLATLAAEGFTVIPQWGLAAFERTVTRLRVPDELDNEQARGRVRAESSLAMAPS